MLNNVPEILSIRNIFEFEYVIPLYQRNFAWQGEQIDQLLRDVYNAWKKSAYDPQLNYFLGTLVLKHRYEHNARKLEVIDGQQRLTVLTLIKRVFDSEVTHSEYKNCLFYDSRQEIVSYLSKISVHTDNRYPQSVKSLIDGESTIRDFLFGKNNVTDLFHNPTERQEFARFFFDKVKLVCVHIPEDTDVAAYFEIMNNRGEQLQGHELLKSRLLNKIEGEKKRYEFASIWDACSEMDGYIQTRFEPEVRKQYFGEELNSFKFAGLGQLPDNLYKTTELKSESINEILSKDKYSQLERDSGNNDNDFDNEAAHNSIIDFPNFLIHVLCAYRFNGDVKSCPLDSKFLLDNFADKTINQPGFAEDFIRHLFYARVCFDCFVIKQKSDESKEGGFSWSLKRPIKNENNSRYLLDTFSDLHQERIIKVQSMLQVSVNTKNYKNWLQMLVLFFKSKDGANNNNIDICNFIRGEEYIKTIDSFVEDQYEQLNINLISYSDGTRTPRFLFNFIDYLYWVAWSRIKSNSSENTLPCLTETNKKQIKNLNNFQFKYWNSVEHHLSQEKAKLKKLESIADNLGNLCLTSRGTNSTLSNRDVLEKIQYSSSNMGMNRQIIYRCTESLKRWETREINSHFIDLSNLLGNRGAILALD